MARFLLAFFVVVFSFVLPARAGWIEDRPDGTTVIHLKIYELPDATQTDANTRAEAAGVRAFIHQFPQIFAKRYRKRYEADPRRYGHHNWKHVEVELSPFVGITVSGVEPDTLAIAGGIAPDVLYVQFRKSDYYIQNRFLYPLDKPQDHYASDMTKAELDYRVNPKIWPVIRRPGPDGQTHIWALPYGGALGTVLLYRKDLFDAKGIPYPTINWTWNDMLDACRKICDPANGKYGLIGGTGQSESWFWLNYLWAAGGEVMTQDPVTKEWNCVFDSRDAAISVDFYNKLNNEKWIDSHGKVRRGYTLRTFYGVDAWNRGDVGMRMDYIDGKLFQTINPELTGMVPTPIGPGGHRGAELNSRMMGLSSQIKLAPVRDAAWEYMRFYDSMEARRIKTRIMVDGGLGPFLNPADLERFGYPEIARLAPKGWSDIFKIAVETGHPEPYGPNAAYIYQITTVPLQECEQLYINNQLPTDREARLKVYEGILHQGVVRANEVMFGRIPAAERHKRNVTAWIFLVAIIITFGIVLYRVSKSFTPPEARDPDRKRKRFGRYFWAYILLIPAALTILAWQYFPLIRGAAMAFQDYKLQGGSHWVGVTNFGNLLYDSYWWHSVWDALKYSFLIMALTFIPPVILAILLQETPQGSLSFRIIFYLPGVLSGLVTVVLWREFYDPTENGVLNFIVLHIPAIAYVAMGLAFLFICAMFARRLWQHDSIGMAVLFMLSGFILLSAFVGWAWPILLPPIPPGTDVSHWARFIGIFKRLPDFPAEPYNWLGNPSTAMLACVIPLVWAGVGPGCLIYLAALKGIPDDFYEAADLDGAGLIDKILFVVFPILRPLILINFIGVFIASWYGAEANILAMTGGAADTTVAGLYLFFKAFRELKFGPATAMAWVLAFMLIGFTIYQLRIISRLEFKTTGKKT